MSRHALFIAMSMLALAPAYALGAPADNPSSMDMQGVSSHSPLVQEIRIATAKYKDINVALHKETGWGRHAVRERAGYRCHGRPSGEPVAHRGRRARPERAGGADLRTDGGRLDAPGGRGVHRGRRRLGRAPPGRPATRGSRQPDEPAADAEPLWPAAGLLPACMGLAGQAPRHLRGLEREGDLREAALVLGGWRTAGVCDLQTLDPATDGRPWTAAANRSPQRLIRKLWQLPGRNASVPASLPAAEAGTKRIAINRSARRRRRACIAAASRSRSSRPASSCGAGSRRTPGLAGSPRTRAPTATCRRKTRAVRKTAAPSLGRVAAPAVAAAAAYRWPAAPHAVSPAPAATTRNRPAPH